MTICNNIDFAESSAEKPAAPRNRWLKNSMLCPLTSGLWDSKLNLVKRNPQTFLCQRAPAQENTVSFERKEITWKEKAKHLL